MLLQGLLVCACALLTLAEQRQSRLVSTAQGPVRGYRNNEGHYEFLGIPYATAPTGPNKFKPPLPPPTWVEPFESVQRLIACPQGLPSGLSSDENCLITNIYVPDTTEINLPVVVHIHGGAFNFGFGTMWKATNLVRTKNVIVVNFNYRLGAQGFLCLGTKDIPGNAGMKDQVTLLRWVQQNIANFGGNPDDVTLHGWSAGAASAHLILISKIGRGLFKKIILDSGSGTASFGVQVDPIANAKAIAQNLNFNDVNNMEAMEAFYKSATDEMLSSVNVVSSPNSSTIFAPCIERDLGDEMFLDEAPLSIITRGDIPNIPILIGIAEMEGIFRLNLFETWRYMMNDLFSDFLPEDLLFTSEAEKDVVTRQVKHFYFNESPVGEETILNYVDYFTDAMFGYGTAKAVKLQVEAGNNQIYLYEYAFTDERDSYITYTNVRGASHCAQSDSVFDESNEDNFTPARKTMKATMRDLYFNFIKTGTPVPIGSQYPAWPAVQRDQTPYMSLNNTLILRDSFLHRRVPLWDEVYSKYFRSPVAPYSL